MVQVEAHRRTIDVRRGGGRLVLWLAIWLLAATAAIYAAASVSAVRVPLRVRLAEAISRRYRRWRPLPVLTTSPPIEEIAANLRRLQGWLDIYAEPQPAPGKATKLVATTLAYDRVLVDACHALEIPESLDDTRGLDREAERLRLQAALADAGFVLTARRRTGS
jgi:hypothetical protein